jgi:hypothetical protein
LSGGGPVGLALDEANDRLYVLTRFDNSITVVDTNTRTELPAQKRSLYNPEPFNVTDGRPFLYDAAFTSSNGEASCSSCHVFGDLDSLGWDLGNPDDTVLNNPNPFVLGPAFNPDFHPMKGPMTTQSLRGMANHGPMHWRGDRTGGNDVGGDPLDEHAAFTKFNVAFEGLLGRTGPLTANEMNRFTDFILDVTYPPNPIRALDNSLTSQQQDGHDFYFNTTVDTLTCNACHTLNENAGFFGGNGESSFENEPQHFKVAHLRNAYAKIGMFGMPAVPFVNAGNNGGTGRQIRAYGYLHDGSIDTVFRFLHATVFSGFQNDTERRAVESFVFAMDSNLRPVVGQQVTLTNTNSAVQDIIDRLNLLDARSNAGDCDVVVKGIVGGLQRGWWRQANGSFQSDRDSESEPNAASLRALANTVGQQLTFTAVPPGSGTRMGVDRDEDGFYDRDELDLGSDPANPLSIPAGTTAVLIPAKKVLIKNKLPDDESKNKIIVLSKSPSITTPALNSSADPRCNADPSGTVKATIEVASTPGGQSLSVPLPCQNWKLLGSTSNPKGYKYADPELDDGVVKLVMWKTGNQLKATFFGKGATTLSYDLQAGVSQSPVRVKLINENTNLCMACNGQPGKDGSDGKIFQGKDCPAPASCD